MTTEELPQKEQRTSLDKFPDGNEKDVVLQKFYRLKQALNKLQLYADRHPEDPRYQQRMKFIEYYKEAVRRVHLKQQSFLLSAVEPFVRKFEAKAEEVLKNEEFFQEFEQLPKIQPEPLDNVNTLSPGFQYVSWGLQRGKTGTFHDTLITTGMGPCCSLAIINKTIGEQKLTHIYPPHDGSVIWEEKETPKHFHQTLGEFIGTKICTHSDSVYYVVEGRSQDRENAYRIYASLRSLGIPYSNIRYVPCSTGRLNVNDEIVGGENIVLSRGNICRASDHQEADVEIYDETFRFKQLYGQACLESLNHAMKKYWGRMLRSHPPFTRTTSISRYGNEFGIKFTQLENMLKSDDEVKQNFGSLSMQERNYAIFTYVRGIVQKIFLKNPERYLS